MDTITIQSAPVRIADRRPGPASMLRSPASCLICMGLGGKGMRLDPYGLTYFTAWCLCPTGQQKRREYDAAVAEKQAANAPSCPECRMQGGYGSIFPSRYSDELRRPAAWCDCPAGHAARAKYEVAEADARLAYLSSRQRERLAAIEIPPRYAGATMADFGGPAALAVKAWLGNRKEGEGLLLWGAVGNGKTRLAAAILKELVLRGEQDNSIRFVTVPELLDRVRDSYQQGGKPDHLIEHVCAAQYLLLDDLGSEKVTDWVRERLFIIVNKRYNDLSPTLATANLSPDVLSERIGDRTVSRLIGMCRVVKIDGGDRRLLGQ